jgi:hypothetical protein
MISSRPIIVADADYFCLAKVKSERFRPQSENPSAPECLEPLTHRINSSNVPADFDETEPGTNRETVERGQTIE